MSKTAIVIGTGIAGASTAFALARRNVAVTIIDAGYDATATSAGAGIIQPWSSEVEGKYYKYYAAGADYYPEVIGHLSEIGISEIGYRQCGGLVVNEDLSVLDQIQERVINRSADALSIGNIERVNSNRAKQLFPPLADGYEGVFISGGARVDGRTLKESLINGTKILGTHIIQGEATLKATNDNTLGVVVNNQLFQADSVVVATGAWTSKIFNPLGISVGVQPQRGQIVHLKLEGVDTKNWPSVHPVTSHYLVSFDDSRVAVGATRETGSGFESRVTAIGQKEILDNALRVAPGLANATYLETRVGLRPLADSGLPIVGKMEQFDNVFINSGFGAGGLTLGPLVGDLLAQQVCGEVPKDDGLLFGQ